MVGALDRRQPDLVGAHAAVEQRRDRPLGPGPVQQDQPGQPLARVLGRVEALGQLHQRPDVVQVVVHQQGGDLRRRRAGRPLDPQPVGRVEVDAVRRGQPVRRARGRPGGHRARGVPVGAGERAGEPLHRVVAGCERGVGDGGAAGELPRGALEGDPAAHRHRRLPGVAGEAAAEVERRGVRAVGHVGQRPVLLVEDGVEELAQPVTPRHDASSPALVDGVPDRAVLDGDLASSVTTPSPWCAGRARRSGRRRRRRCGRARRAAARTGAGTAGGPPRA